MISIQEAEEYLNESKAIEPNHGKTYYYLGRCYGENKQRVGFILDLFSIFYLREQNCIVYDFNGCI